MNTIKAHEHKYIAGTIGDECSFCGLLRTTIEQEKHCEPEYTSYLTIPPQSRCKNCRQFWVTANETPLCRSVEINTIFPVEDEEHMTQEVMGGASSEKLYEQPQEWKDEFYKKFCSLYGFIVYENEKVLMGNTKVDELFQFIEKTISSTEEQVIRELLEKLGELPVRFPLPKHLLAIDLHDYAKSKNIKL